MTTAASPAGRWKDRLSRTLLDAVRARRVEVKAAVLDDSDQGGDGGQAIHARLDRLFFR
jgi:hypothetical protein